MTADGVGTPWVANELRQVQQAGIPFKLHALRLPGNIAHKAEWAADMNGSTNAIYALDPFRLIASVFTAPFIFRGRYCSALANALFARRENVRARVTSIAHFFVAAYWALMLRGERVDLIHAQWIHSSGTVAMYGAWLLDVPFSFTGHAVDLFSQRVALEDKIRRAAFIVCISTFHRDFYVEHGAEADKLLIVYCGIDLGQFRPPDARKVHEPFTILAAGRLIEKKGFEHLLRACRQLVDQGRTLKCTIGGSGPLQEHLRRVVEALGLAGSVTITGEALKQEDIPVFMAQGDLFCLPCVWAKDGDVDGLPQLLMEAMACGLPVVSTRLVGIPDLVMHEKTGLLTSPEDEEELAEALAYAMDNHGHMLNLASNGRRHLEQRFDISTCLQPLLEKFEAFVDRGQRPRSRMDASGAAFAAPASGPGRADSK